MDCIRCGTLLDTDEGICPTCGDVYGRTTAYQMPQLTADQISKSHEAPKAAASAPKAAPAPKAPAPAAETAEAFEPLEPPDSAAPSSKNTLIVFFAVLIVAVILGLVLVFVLLT